MKQLKRKIVLSLVFPSVVLCLLAAAAVVSNAGSASAAGVSKAHSSSHHGSSKKSHNTFQITVSPSSGNPNSTFVVNGKGATPNGSVSVSVGQLAATTVTADALGNFNTTLTAPGAPGQYRVAAIDQTTSNFTSSSFKVNGPVTSSPTITVFPTTVNPNDTLTITGTGFTPGGTGFAYTPDGNGGFNTVMFTADAHGNITVS